MTSDDDARPPRHAFTFSASAILLGCVATAFVFTVLLFGMLATDPGVELEVMGSAQSTGRLALSLGGLTLLVLLVVGPTLAWALSRLLGPRQQQVAVHVIAFAVLGLLVGLVLGTVLAGPGFGLALAPLLGVGGAAGRVAVQPLAR